VTSHYNGSNALRCCGGCGGSFLADDRNRTYLCPKCTAAQPEFDPQPYEKCQGRPDKQRCRYGPRLAEHVVLAREGDMVTVRPLGFPEAEPVTVHLNELTPQRISYGR
jgi:hypothetical protein